MFFGVQRRVWSALRSFLNSSTSHFRSLLKITCLHENMQEFLLELHLTPWDSFGWRKNLFLVLRSFWKCSQVFFQVKRNQKHIYNVFIRPKLNIVGQRENSKICPSNLEIERTFLGDPVCNVVNLTKNVLHVVRIGVYIGIRGGKKVGFFPPQPVFWQYIFSNIHYTSNFFSRRNPYVKRIF